MDARYMTTAVSHLFAARRHPGNATYAASEPRPASGIVTHFSSYAGLFAWIVIGIVVFDLFQAFFDYGFYKSGSAGGFWAFIPANLPFYLLHSFISLVVCFVLLLYLDDGLEQLRWQTASTLGFLALSAGLISFLYTAARVQFAYEKSFGAYGLDMAVLIAAINVSAAMLAFASAALCKRQAEASRLRQQPTPHQAPASAPATSIADAQNREVAFVSPAAAGG